MSFNYQHEKNKHQENFWTSYADLYTTLFTIFLFIYVGSTLRQGTKTLEQVNDKKYLSKQVEDLKQQLKVYQALKDDYMKKEATDEESKMYDELMGKLDLLQDEAKSEKEALRQKAMENERKEKALNKYQQLIRNIINSNVLAKTKIQHRNDMITEKEDVIDQQTTEIAARDADIAAKRTQIANKEHQIEQVNSELKNKVTELQKAYQSNKLTKQEMENKIQNLKANTAAQVAQLQNQAEEIQSELAGAKSKLAKTKSDLEATNQALAQTNAEKGSLENQLATVKGDLENKLAEAQGKHQKAIADAQAKFQGELDKAKAGFADALNKEKLSGAGRAAREKAFRDEMAGKEKEYQGRIAALKQKYDDTQGELKKAIDQINTRKKLADQIRNRFSKNGIKVDVDEKTGEVVLDFKNSYFDTGKAQLKKEMVDTLNKFVPIYTEGLFEDEKTASKIGSVEIIGFASPTYKGKYVDPSSLDASNRSAVNYNLDLSYNRAKSIFSYVFNTDKMQFRNQQRLMGLVKVTGRSFLNQGTSKGNNGDDFCKINDCKKEQRVIIKFNLKD